MEAAAVSQRIVLGTGIFGPEISMIRTRIAWLRGTPESALALSNIRHSRRSHRGPLHFVKSMNRPRGGGFFFVWRLIDMENGPAS